MLKYREVGCINEWVRGCGGLIFRKARTTDNAIAIHFCSAGLTAISFVFTHNASLVCCSLTSWTWLTTIALLHGLYRLCCMSSPHLPCLSCLSCLSCMPASLDEGALRGASGSSAAEAWRPHGPALWRPGQQRDEDAQDVHHLRSHHRCAGVSARARLCK